MGKYHTKFYQKWALNIFLHSNAHFTIFFSVDWAHHLILPLYLLFLRDNNEFLNSRLFLLWQTGAKWARNHSEDAPLLNLLIFTFTSSGGTNTWGQLYVDGNNRWLGSTHNHLNAPSTHKRIGPIYWKSVPVPPLFICDRRASLPLRGAPYPFPPAGTLTQSYATVSKRYLWYWYLISIFFLYCCYFHFETCAYDRLKLKNSTWFY